MAESEMDKPRLADEEQRSTVPSPFIKQESTDDLLPEQKEEVKPELSASKCATVLCRRMLWREGVPEC